MAALCRLRHAASLVFAAALVSACTDEVPRYDGTAFDRDPPPVGPLHGRIVTSNAGDDTLSVIDPAAPGAARRLVVGFSPVELEGPHHLAADPAGRYLYVNLSLAVAGSGGGPHGTHGGGDLAGYALKLDTATGREVGRVQVDPNPGDNVLSADGKTLFVTHYDLVRWAKGVKEGDLRKGDSNLIAVDTERMQVLRKVPLCPAAHGVRPSADGRWLFATCGPDEIAVVDLSDPTWPVRRVLLPGATEGATCSRCPYALSVAPDGEVWVSSIGQNGARGSIDIYDPATGAFTTRSLSLRGSAMFAAFHGSAASYRAYVPEQGSAGDFLRVYEVGGGEGPREQPALPLGRRDCLGAHMLLVAADGARGHLVCEGDHRGPGSLVWLDLATTAVIGSTATGVFPDGLVLVPERAAR